ncbi:MAG: sigma 54-interacting transcriptional regulator [Planctomycetota bacterium]
MTHDIKTYAIPKLIVLDGPIRGAVLRLQPGTNRIGRDPSVELMLPDKLISRRHAEMRLTGEGTTLDDLGSTNATYLNGLRVTSARQLQHGDEVRLGDTVLLYVHEAPSPAPSTAPAPAGDVFGDTAKLRSDLEPIGDLVATGRLTESRARCLVGDSDSLRRISELVARCAPLDTTVLIVGESGTGKELVSEALHRQGPRRSEPFVVVNCATLEPTLLESELFGHERGAFTGAVARRLGKLELVGAGTLFLDEVGELPPEAQAKLLRAIDKRQFQRVGGHKVLTTHARFVGATHRDLTQMVKDGLFREDLLFRLRVVEIQIPPLRKRTEDIPPIVEHVMAELLAKIPAKARSLSEDAMEALLGYRFPGNVRELRNILERCLIFCEREVIEVADLPHEVRAQLAPAARGDSEPSGELATLEDLERRQIERALNKTGGNKTQAAKLLGIDRVTLYSKLKRHSIPK